MSQRLFEVEISETVVQYKTVKVFADSFDEARDKVYDRDWYDWYLNDESAEDIDIDAIECRECGSDNEDDCSCDFDVTANPNWREGWAPEDLSEGDWVTPDEYTSGHTCIPKGTKLKVIEVGDRDSDGDYYFRGMTPEGDRKSCYLNEACRFSPVPEPTDEEMEAARAEREEARKREEAEYERLLQRRRERRMVEELLYPFS